MADEKSPPDLSMDEILATIRRIIAEDDHSGPGASGAGTAGKAEPAGAAGGTSAAPNPPLRTRPRDDDVLELTAAINEDGSVRHLAPIGSTSATRAAPPIAEATTTPAPSAPAAPGANLVSETASAAAAAAFARVLATPHPPHEPAMVGGRPLEDVVRDLLRPLLQDWLDENLPRIVERLVATEIARIAGKAAPA